jgi:hypothetical protein
MKEQVHLKEIGNLLKVLVDEISAGLKFGSWNLLKNANESYTHKPKRSKYKTLFQPRPFAESHTPNSFQSAC